MKTTMKLYGLMLFAGFVLNACGQSKKEVISKPGNPYYSNSNTKKVTISNAEWKKILPADVYEITRKAGTEQPYTGKYWNSHIKGTYYCAACGNKVFDSDTKFESGTGWPSFYQPYDNNSVIFKTDNSLSESRTEVQCARCGGHLGHVFDDGPKPTGKRFCMNSDALDFYPDKK